MPDIKSWKNQRNKRRSKHYNNHKAVFYFTYAAYRKGEETTMTKITTTTKISTALSNEMLEVTNAEIYYKTLGTTETVNTSIFCESLDFLCKSGIFTDALGWHFERDCKSNGYIAECGRMNPDTEFIITAYLSVCDGVNVKDVEKTLLFMEE